MAFLADRRHAGMRRIGGAIHQLGFALEVALEDLLQVEDGADVAVGIGQRHLGARLEACRLRFGRRRQRDRNRPRQPVAQPHALDDRHVVGRVRKPSSGLKAPTAIMSRSDSAREDSGMRGSAKSKMREQIFSPFRGLPLF